MSDGRVDETGFLASVGECLPPGAHPAVTAVPVPYLAYEGLQVEIEGYAMRREDGERTPRTFADTGAGSPLPDPFCQGVRSGRMIFVSAQSPIDATGQVLHPGDLVAQTRQAMAQVGEVLASFGADYDDVVKLNRWYAGDVGIADFEPAALACAAHFREPGPAATGIPLPRHADESVKVRIAVLAMLGEDGRRLPRRHVWPESLWDWHVHLPYKHGLQCEEMIFLGGQVSLDKRGQAVHPNDLSAQTHQAMVHIGTILSTLGELRGDVQVHELEVTDRAQQRALGAALASEAIDVLIHNAGVYGTGMRAATVNRINAEAPIEVVEALMGAVLRSNQKKIALISSQVGARRGSRRSLGKYGDSKAALNDRFRATVRVQECESPGPAASPHGPTQSGANAE